MCLQSGVHARTWGGLVSELSPPLTARFSCARECCHRPVAARQRPFDERRPTQHHRTGPRPEHAPATTPRAAHTPTQPAAVDRVGDSRPCDRRGRGHERGRRILKRPGSQRLRIEQWARHTRLRPPCFHGNRLRRSARSGGRRRQGRPVGAPQRGRLPAGHGRRLRGRRQAGRPAGLPVDRRPRQQPHPRRRPPASDRVQVPLGRGPGGRASSFLQRRHLRRAGRPCADRQRGGQQRRSSRSTSPTAPCTCCSAGPAWPARTPRT